MHRRPSGQREDLAPEQKLRSLSMPPQSGPSSFSALSKVSEEASSLDRQSSGDSASGKGLMTDSQGRQSTSTVLGNIHEQVCKPPLAQTYPAACTCFTLHGTALPRHSPSMCAYIEMPFGHKIEAEDPYMACLLLVMRGLGDCGESGG